MSCYIGLILYGFRGMADWLVDQVNSNSMKDPAEKTLHFPAQVIKNENDCSGGKYQNLV